jgi:hypothetical protein
MPFPLVIFEEFFGGKYFLAAGTVNMPGGDFFTGDIR